MAGFLSPPMTSGTTGTSTGMDMMGPSTQSLQMPTPINDGNI
jgi:hypothetical protein